ncbi:hypothetical protein GCM10023192_60520 [Amycolatopsis samaneae]
MDRYPVVYRSGGNPTVNSYFRLAPGPGSWPGPGVPGLFIRGWEQQAGAYFFCAHSPAFQSTPS